MTYKVAYARRIRVTGQDVVRIGLVKECPETKDPEAAYKEVRAQVEAWLRAEIARILNAPGTEPAGPPVFY